MNIPRTHPWSLTPRRAIELQRELAAQIVERDENIDLRLVAGVDVGFEGADNKIARAAVVVLEFSTLVPVEAAVARAPVKMPYIPGLLAFREVPVVLRALRRLRHTPDVIVVDGHGRAHPRGMGIASHLGIVIDRPTIGCAKSVLCGEALTPANKVGAWTPLIYEERTIGAVLRTRTATRPVYVSVGHRTTLAQAIEVVMGCCRGYRLPETTRWAHRIAGGEELNVRSLVRGRTE
ncbi:MAG: deoxyribonuclease V [Chloroflexi bacterium]|nr:deoxyribonuclease V [Chloroflexota bacterium]